MWVKNWERSCCLRGGHSHITSHSHITQHSHIYQARNRERSCCLRGGILTLPKLGDSLDTRSEKKKKTGGRKRGDHWLSTSFSTHFLPIPLSHLISELENFLADALSHQSWKNICCNCAVSSMYCLPKSFNIFVFHTSMYFAIATLKRSVFELLKKVMPMM